jgi:two-component system copper resistance phosphate regulon response regulator CusR
MRILIIEDDAPLTNVLKHAFEREGHSVEVGYDGEVGVRMVNRSEWDLLLLDLTLPKVDGFEVLKQAVEGHREMRVLVLSGRSRIEDRVRALDEGADDFLLKPFSLMELSARVRAILRRSGTNEKTILQIGDLVLDRLHGTVRRANRDIELTPKEFSLLELLASNTGKAVSRLCILREVWKIQSNKPSNIVDVYINYLRKKIDEQEMRKLVHTIRGVGYSLGERPDSEPRQLRVLNTASVVREMGSERARGVHSA